MMTSPLYARYIPPGRISKTGNPNLGVLKKVSNPKLANPIDIQPDASATYTRYIPPSKKNGNLAEIHDSSGSHPVKAIVELKSQISSLTSTEQGKLENQSKRDTVGDVKSSLNPEESIELSQRPKKRRKAELDIKKHIIDAKDPSETEINTFHSESPQSLAKEFNKDETVKHQIKGSKSSLTDNVFEGDKRHLNLLKKREISIKKSARIVKDTLEDDEKRETPTDPDEIHDLVPLPQPEPIPESNPDPSVNLLPPWLANPIRVSPEKTVEFKEFGLNDHATKSLQAKGFTSAFAVQAAVLPLLLPGAHQDAGDIVISAATGSGKTLAYVLPMIHDISRYRVSKLRGLIILPTRELVSQAKVVIEICATAFSDSNRKRVKIGTAVGNENLKVERQTLIEQCQKYDPQGYKENLRRAELPWQDIECDLDGGYKIICDENPSRLLPDHVEDYKVKVNVLICTPGRLVEHLKSTPGFNVKDIKWLVIDEADKLLDQSFQQWLPAVLAQIESQQFDPNFKKDRVRKVILSATMTRDLGKLAQLKLYRPRFILLKSEDKTSDHTQQYTLPSLLIESGVKVEEDSIKPLYLMELLKRESILKLPSSTEDDSSSDSESSSSSSNSSSTSNSNQSSESLVASPKVINLTESKNAETPRGVLIFTKSNETAVRLGRLITLLYPSSSSLIGILTSTLPRISRQRCLQSFARKRMSILVASDLASRGLDLPNLAHVINYDIPSSLVSYIHRVGRTARAGKKGHAWTLFSSTEGRWFWNEIGRSPNIHRPCGKVERTNIKKEALSSKQREAYEIALAKLETEANSFGLRQKAPKDYDNTLVK